MAKVLKWTKRKLIKYLRQEGWLDKRPGFYIPDEVRKKIPKVLKQLNRGIRGW